MTAAEIRRHYNAAPFRAFRIHMANGRWVDVPQPEFMWISRTGKRLIVDMEDDSFEIIDIPLVTSLETLPKNGKRRKKRGKR